MFNVTSDHIAKLNDTDLRTLIGLLCEADAVRLGRSRVAVTWGGKQTAADGGIDVRVALPDDVPVEGFLCRAKAGFQVKAMDLPPGAISDEMCGKCGLRPSIRELLEAGGAYIIVSSKGTIADSKLKDRRNAMTKAAGSAAKTPGAVVDFYDRNRIASWVREHPAWGLWLRERIGEPVRGWHAFGAWAGGPEGVEAPYLVDDQLRIREGHANMPEGLSVETGIARMRTLLRLRGSVVRLVGLSGVGKTRLVQVLFDERVGEDALEPSLAWYSNIGDSPDPQPVELVTRLIAERTRAIVVVDNCGADLHRRLGEIVRVDSSRVSVLTIEYDIRDDEPEGTEVFRLAPSSDELMELLLSRRFPALSQVDRRTIAGFSGGNARVATAIASTVGRDETISGLRDEELFERLFRQRRDGDHEALLEIAEACSLVYSFDSEVTESNDCELAVLGPLVGRGSRDLFRGVAELLDRDLVQRRGKWRAVLPHAIANRLAAQALRKTPSGLLKAQLVEGPSSRLLKSFARRLGYLHESEEAAALVTEWLSPEGLLGNATELDEFRRAMFLTVAPVAPECALAAMERADWDDVDTGLFGRDTEFVSLLHSIAYDPALFDRCADLLAEIALRGGESLLNAGQGAFKSLFSIMLSGTHATLEQRVAVATRLLASPDEVRQELGILALEQALETSHFSSLHSFEFGARSRDYGWRPDGPKAIDLWYESWIGLCCEIALSGGGCAGAARSVLARHLRGLWFHTGLHAQLASLAREISSFSYWAEGWLAVRQTLHFHASDMTPELLAALKALEADLCPNDLVQRVRAVVLSSPTGVYDYADSDDDEVDDGAATSSWQRASSGAGKARCRRR